MGYFFDKYCGALHLESFYIKQSINIIGALHL
jgi:hypothetical protein